MSVEENVLESSGEKSSYSEGNKCLELALVQSEEKAACKLISDCFDWASAKHTEDDSDITEQVTGDESTGISPADEIAPRSLKDTNDLPAGSDVYVDKGEVGSCRKRSEERTFRRQRRAEQPVPAKKTKRGRSGRTRRNRTVIKNFHDWENDKENMQPSSVGEQENVHCGAQKKTEKKYSSPLDKFRKLLSPLKTKSPIFMRTARQKRKVSYAEPSLNKLVKYFTIFNSDHGWISRCYVPLVELVFAVICL